MRFWIVVITCNLGLERTGINKYSTNIISLIFCLKLFCYELFAFPISDFGNLTLVLCKIKDPIRSACAHSAMVSFLSFLILDIPYILCSCLCYFCGSACLKCTSVTFSMFIHLASVTLNNLGFLLWWLKRDPASVVKRLDRVHTLIVFVRLQMDKKKRFVNFISTN